MVKEVYFHNIYSILIYTNSLTLAKKREPNKCTTQWKPVMVKEVYSILCSSNVWLLANIGRTYPVRIQFIFQYTHSRWHWIKQWFGTKSRPFKRYWYDGCYTVNLTSNSNSCTANDKNRRIQISSQWRLRKFNPYFIRPRLCCNGQLLI